MSTIGFIAAVILSIFYIVYKRKGQLSVKKAREYFNNGAIVVDVRSKAEYDAGHLSQAVNAPVDTIAGTIAGIVYDRTKVVLLHCQNGGRSQKAADRLKAMGYRNAHNLGSYGRAFYILTGRKF